MSETIKVTEIQNLDYIRYAKTDRKSSLNLSDVCVIYWMY